MTEAEIKKKAESLYKKMGSGEKKEFCQFLVDNDDRYCRATTHTSCVGCRFYTLTFRGKLRALVTYILRLEEQIKTLKTENKELKHKTRGMT